MKTISEVHIAHAEAGGEAPDMNTRAYTIEVSEDGKEFTQVTRIINNEKGETVDTFAATKAQFVRFTSDKPTQGADSAVRIYEIGVYGLKIISCEKRLIICSLFFINENGIVTSVC